MSFDPAGASEDEWHDLADELANYYDEINKQNARELLRSSYFGDASDEGQVKQLVKSAEEVKAQQ